MDNAAQQADTREEVEDKPQSSDYWLHELEAYHSRCTTWLERADKIEKRFENERADSDKSRRMNVLYSNTETLHSALYGKSAKPDVRRRFMDKTTNNALNRRVAEILERSLDYCIDAYDVDDPLDAALHDHLIGGRGQAWVAYEPTVSADPKGQPVITAQDTEVEYIHYSDFAHGFGRRWKDVPWVGRKRHGTKKELENIIGTELPDTVQPEQIETGEQQDKAEKDTGLTRYAVWEIWDKKKRERHYVVKGYKFILKTDEDPYQLKGFFPSPRPLYGPKGTKRLVPTPEFLQYQDQADEVDEATYRIGYLMEQLKWRGFAKSAGEDGQELPNIADAGDGEFIPIATFPGESGRALWEQLIAEQPLETLVNTIAQLRAHRQEAINEIYQITGISDIIRGYSDPNETATAQRIKGQFGSMRLKKRQAEVQRFIRDLYRIKGELIAEHWTAETFAGVTGFEMPTAQQKQEASARVAMLQAFKVEPNPQVAQVAQAPITWEDVLKVLRSDALRSYAIDIETDSTIFEDAEAEKQARVEFTNALTGMFERAGPMIQVFPQATPLIKEITLFGVRGFKTGRTVEESIEEAFDAIQQAVSQPQPQASDPEADKAAADAKKAELDAVNKDKELQAKAQAEMMKARQASDDADRKMSIEREKIQADVAIAEKKALTDQKIAFANMQKDLQVELARLKSQSAADEEGKASNEKSIAVLTELMQSLSAQMAAPTRVIKDEFGDVIGIEKVM